MLSSIVKVYPVFAWCGSLIILLGCLVTIYFYRGKAGERYSLLNHYISELGEVGVSKLARVFNLAMILCGISFIPVMLGIGLPLTSFWAKAGMVAGVLAAVSAVLVGVFPMSNLNPHRKAAMTYFRTGMITILLFTVAIFVQPPTARQIPLSVNGVGIFTLLAYASFLIIVGRKMDKNGNPNYILDPNAMPERPAFWRSAFLEWLVFITTIIWFLSVAIFS